MMLETIRQNCPYCGEQIELVLDVTASGQEYIEDCSVCCRPIVLTFSYDADTQHIDLMVKTENE